MTSGGDVLLGIDLGTTNLKCVALSVDGDISELAAVPVASTIEGRAYEQDPGGWWRALQHACADAVHGGFDLSRVAAVGLTGHMHGAVLIGRHGDPVRSCLTWADTRAVAETRELKSTRGDRFLSVTRNEVDVVFTAPKLLWIARHDAGSFRAARRIISPKDLLRARLTGGWGTDRTDAAGTMLLDVATDEWSPELLAAVGITPDVMPTVDGSATVIGAVTGAAASATGLPAGVPVVAGSGDIASATLGAGMVRPDQVYVNVGTAAQVLSIHEGLDAPKRYWLAHISPDMSIHSSTVFGAGLAHAAVARTVSPSGSMTVEERFERLDAAAAEIEFGSDGLMFIPSLGRPDGEREGDGAGGQFTGSPLSPAHSYRAVLEGVALAIGSLVPDASKSVRVGGGIRRSDLWLTILASVLGTPIEIIDHDASPVGAAMLAGIGIGWFTSPTDAVDRCLSVGRVVDPFPVRGLDEIKHRFAVQAAGRAEG